MNEDITKRVNPQNLEQAIQMLRSQIGEKEAQKIAGAFQNSSEMQNLTSRLAPKDLDMVVKIMNNPDALRMILSSQKAREGLKNFLK